MTKPYQKEKKAFIKSWNMGDFGIGLADADLMGDWVVKALTKQKAELRKKIDYLIIKDMKEYANTALKNRLNAYDALYNVSVKIQKLLK